MSASRLNKRKYGSKLTDLTASLLLNKIQYNTLLLFLFLRQHTMCCGLPTITQHLVCSTLRVYFLFLLQSCKEYTYISGKMLPSTITCFKLSGWCIPLIWLTKLCIQSNNFCFYPLTYCAY